MSNKRKGIQLFAIIFGVLITLFLVFFIYTLDFYKLIPYTDDSFDDLLIVEDRHVVTYGNKDSEVGIIFYQGGKVDERAYDLFLLKIASEGFFVISVKMPFNLAVFGSSLAIDVIEDYDEIDTWFLMGHSLGGAMASTFAAKYPHLLDGLILLSAYASSDLSETDLSMLSIYGSRDGVLSMEQVEETKTNNPSKSTYVIINGGNHSGFANYGFQKKDLEADISSSTQQDLTVAAIIEFIRASS
jgi:hypothetical protein